MQDSERSTSDAPRKVDLANTPFILDLVMSLTMVSTYVCAYCGLWRGFCHPSVHGSGSLLGMFLFPFLVVSVVLAIGPSAICVLINYCVTTFLRERSIMKQASAATAWLAVSSISSFVMCYVATIYLLGGKIEFDLLSRIIKWISDAGLL